MRELRLITWEGEGKGPNPLEINWRGTTAVASISTFARSSISAATTTTAIAGKCRPITSR